MDSNGHVTLLIDTFVFDTILGRGIYRENQLRICLFCSGSVERVISLP